MTNLHVKVKVKPINKDDLAKKIALLNPDDCLYFWTLQYGDELGEETFGVRFIEEFEAWIILINVVGGGFATVIEYFPGSTEETELKRLSDCLHDFCNQIGSHKLFISEAQD